MRYGSCAFFETTRLNCVEKAKRMGGPPGYVDPNPPIGGYFDGYVIYTTPRGNAFYWTLSCSGNDSDPVWIFFATD